MGENVDIYGKATHLLREESALKPRSFASVTRRFYLDKMKVFSNQKITKRLADGENLTIGFDCRVGNRHLFSDTFGRSKVIQKSDLLRLPELLQQAVHVYSSPITKPRKDHIETFHYFKAEIHGKEIYLNVAREVRRVNGRRKINNFLYSITDKIKK